LPTLPEIMAASEHLANTMERACTDAVEAAAMQHRLGETFRASVIDVTGTGGLVQLSDPAILAHADGLSMAGTEATVQLVEADVATRTVRFQVVGGVTAQ
jgi:exoribonuclease R